MTTAVQLGIPQEIVRQISNKVCPEVKARNKRKMEGKAMKKIIKRGQPKVTHTMRKTNRVSDTLKEAAKTLAAQAQFLETRWSQGLKLEAHHLTDLRHAREDVEDWLKPEPDEDNR